MIWLPDLGIGYYRVEDPLKPYDAAYFAKYAGYARTEMGQKLTASRIDFVARHWDRHVVDVGIGSGDFVRARPFTDGFDVNPVAVAWLHERNLFCDPYTEPVAAVTLWDVLEHMPDFDRLLARVAERVFVCLPVFRGPMEARTSRHFRPDEHCWYFTSFGFIHLMRSLGWQLLEHHEEETRLGRDSIASFAFKRLQTQG